MDEWTGGRKDKEDDERTRRPSDRGQDKLAKRTNGQQDGRKIEDERTFRQDEKIKTNNKERHEKRFEGQN